MIRNFGLAILGVASLASLLRADDTVPPAKRSPDEVLLVSNANSPISRSIADDYAGKRGVKNTLAVECIDSAVEPDNETIPLADYTRLIEKPIQAYLAAHPGIDFIVLTKGVPIRISGADTGERPDDSRADTPLNTSLDSHLAAMDYQTIPDARKISITGSGATGLGWANRYWNAHEPFSHAKFGGYLVTRLDGYTEADAKALVTRALESETDLAHGKILLDLQPDFGINDKTLQPAAITGTIVPKEWDYGDYNADMLDAHEMLDKRGIPNELNMAPTFVGHRSNLTGYFSWGSNDDKFSSKAYQSLRFAPGSIGDTAVSTSGRTFLPTDGGGQSLLADLLRHGLTCGKGYTDEPLLQANASPTILLDRYTSGYTMAESFYASSRFVGWQDIIVGDPLCCPYPRKATK
jgi:uncharacterized protein (TIGR03790 family)